VSHLGEAVLLEAGELAPEQAVLDLRVLLGGQIGCQRFPRHDDVGLAVR
jgi:hypothetical protein